MRPVHIVLAAILTLLLSCDAPVVGVDPTAAPTQSATGEVTPIVTATLTATASITVTSKLEPIPQLSQPSTKQATMQVTPTTSPTRTPTGTPAVATPSPVPSAPTVMPAPSATLASVESIELVIDNRDPQFTTNGHWFIGDGGQSYAGDCSWAPRGIGNVGRIAPEFPKAGAYEVFAWWCGDPNHDQTPRAEFHMHPTTGFVAYQAAPVNIKEDAGKWHSLGTYYFEANGFISIGSNLQGNIVFDALKLVYRGDSRDFEVTPTPLPTPTIIVTNNPPSPLAQLTARDLGRRLGIVQGAFYRHTPITASEEQSFDDCQAFPRDSCGGTREGWRVQVQYQDLVVPYRVSKDYRHVVVEPSAELARRQRIYLEGYKALGDGSFRQVAVDRYPDGVWYFFVEGRSNGALQAPLRTGDADLASLLGLVDRYSSIQIQSEDGWDVWLYGLGERVELSEADRSQLLELVREWQSALPQIAPYIGSREHRHVRAGDVVGLRDAPPIAFHRRAVRPHRLDS